LGIGYAKGIVGASVVYAMALWNSANAISLYFFYFFFLN
jgi:hypothetical protein